MSPLDVVRYAFQAIRRSALRTGLMLTAMAIGVAAVVLLTSLGEGARRYVIGEFASLGTNLLIVMPGRSETTGGTLMAGFGGTERPLTVEDAAALQRHHSVAQVAPIVVGAVGAEANGLEREVPVLGTTRELLPIRHWRLASGRFLRTQDWSRAAPVCVIGQRVREELFAGVSPLGQWLRVGDSRFRVIGVLASEGRSIGVDVQEIVVVPVASAMALFDTDSMFRVLVEAASREAVAPAKRFVESTLRTRHKGKEDFTVVTQDAVLGTFDQIISVLTLAVGGIAAISLAVAGVLIMNVMLVSVAQRTAEIGLLKAIGAPSQRIVLLFLTEAAMLSLLGALVGLAIGLAAAGLVSALFPVLDMSPPVWAVGSAVAIAVGTGLVFGIAPARRAARLDPVIALARR